jgi:hypothetical protein
MKGLVDEPIGNCRVILKAAGQPDIAIARSPVVAAQKNARGQAIFSPAEVRLIFGREGHRMLSMNSKADVRSKRLAVQACAFGRPSALPCLSLLPSHLDLGANLNRFVLEEIAGN